MAEAPIYEWYSRLPTFEKGVEELIVCRRIEERLSVNFNAPRPYS
jgi:hypothetical protein